jgi:hypothetical protein
VTVGEFSLRKGFLLPLHLLAAEYNLAVPGLPCHPVHPLDRASDGNQRASVSLQCWFEMMELACEQRGVGVCL